LLIQGLEEDAEGAAEMLGVRERETTYNKSFVQSPSSAEAARDMLVAFAVPRPPERMGLRRGLLLFIQGKSRENLCAG